METTVASEPKPKRRSGVPWRHFAPVACWLMIALWTVFALIRLFGLERTWYLDSFMAFTPYMTMLSLVPLIFAVVLRRWYAVAAALVVTVVLGTFFVPRAFGGPDPGKGPTLRVMSSNMDIGAADPQTIVNLIRTQRIDLIGFDEFTPQAQRRLSAAGLTTLLPFNATHPLDGATGSAIYSRFPLSQAGYQLLAGGFGQEYAMVAVPGAMPLEFIAVHTRAPGYDGSQSDWAKSIAQEPSPSETVIRLLGGDFNATFDQKPLRKLAATGYTDIASQLGDGLTPTWPYDGRNIPPITLDHFFADPRVGAVSFGAQKVDGTDHRAIWATVTLPPA